MSHRPYHQQDRNQKEIVAALRKAGASVAAIKLGPPGFPDLVISHFGRTMLVEVKNGNEPLRETQKDFIAKWKAPVHVVRTVDEALKLLEWDNVRAIEQVNWK